MEKEEVEAMAFAFSVVNFILIAVLSILVFARIDRIDADLKRLSPNLGTEVQCTFNGKTWPSRFGTCYMEDMPK